MNKTTKTLILGMTVAMSSTIFASNSDQLNQNIFLQQLTSDRQHSSVSSSAPAVAVARKKNYTGDADRELYRKKEEKIIEILRKEARDQKLAELREKKGGNS